MTDQVNGSPIKVNPDFLTDMKLVSKDPMVVQYDINPKAKWNDGSDIDWTAFKATWEANNGSNPDYNPPSTDGFDRIASVEQGDSPKQVKVTYKTPYYPWQEVFGALVNPKADDPKTFTQGWVKNPHNEWAAGPYKVDSFSDSQVTFVPNEKWWGNKPKLDKIVYKQMADTASLNAFQNGEIDAVEASTKDDIKAIRSVKDAQLRIGYSTKTRVLLEQDPARKLYATGHHNIVNVSGTDEWIIAYHRFAYNPAGRWAGGDGCHREVVFAPLDYNPDGSLVPVRPQVGSYVRSLAF